MSGFFFSDFSDQKYHHDGRHKTDTSLGGRVAHTNRYRRERDELREALRIERQTSQALRRELEQLRRGEQLGLDLAE